MLCGVAEKEKKNTHCVNVHIINRAKMFSSQPLLWETHTQRLKASVFSNMSKNSFILFWKMEKISLIAAVSLYITQILKITIIILFYCSILSRPTSCGLWRWASAPAVHTPGDVWCDICSPLMKQWSASHDVKGQSITAQLGQTGSVTLWDCG